MDAIKDIIPHVIAPLSAGQARAEGIAELWQRLSGDSRKSSVASFKEGVLVVHVDCSARLVKMNQSKPEYLEDLKAKNPNVKDIRFKVGKI